MNEAQNGGRDELHYLDHYAGLDFASVRVLHTHAFSRWELLELFLSVVVLFRTQIR